MGFVFRRPALAQRIADDLLGRSVFSSNSGLFLAGARRTGKSFFLKNELVPLLRKEKVEVAYADLWEDRTRDPAATIFAALRERFPKGPLSKLRDSAGLDELNLLGFRFDLTKLGTPNGPTVTDAVRALCEATGKQVCLIVDEAQHALSTPDGRNITFSLKAARDALNMGDGGLSKGVRGRNLLLVFTGSNRHRLAEMTLSREQAFYGASVQAFPLLGRPYALAYAEWMNARMSADKRIPPDLMAEGFSLLWERPEFLRDAALAHIERDEDFMIAVGKARAEEWMENERLFGSLTPLQQSVMLRVCGGDGKSEPFGQEAADSHRAGLGREVTKPEIRAAMEVLIENDMVWRSDRGYYVPENPSMTEWVTDVAPKIDREGRKLQAPAMVQELLDMGITKTLLVTFLNCTVKTLAAWQGGQPPRNEAVTRLVRVHGLLVGSGRDWKSLLAACTDLPALLRHDPVDWGEIKRVTAI